MKVLFLATRSPWPSMDGGRVLMARTLEGLRAQGHAVTIVAPTHDGVSSGDSTPDGFTTVLVPVRSRSLAPSIITSFARRTPGSVTRHTFSVVADAVSRLISREAFDVVHVEQLHALPHAAPAAGAGIPVVLRAENVESDLWRDVARARSWGRLLVQREAAKIERWEAEALTRVAVTAAITAKDAARMRQLSPAARIEVVKAPMPAELPAGTGALDGAPAIVLLSSRWFPNHDGVAWFLRDIWPSVFASLPAARLHVFGTAGANGGAGVLSHPAPDDARSIFLPGSIFVVPLRIASGASIRILEAWARGVPVVATRTAAAGLDVLDSPAVALADTAADFAQACSVLSRSPDAAAHAVALGRRMLREHHDPTRVAGDLGRLYETALDRSARPAVPA